VGKIFCAIAIYRGIQRDTKVHGEIRTGTGGIQVEYRQDIPKIHARGGLTLRYSGIPWICCKIARCVDRYRDTAGYQGYGEIQAECTGWIYRRNIQKIHARGRAHLYRARVAWLLLLLAAAAAPC